MSSPGDPVGSFSPLATVTVEELRDTMPPESDILDVADVFSLLGDPARLRILVALASGRMRVRDIAEVTGASESSVSHALRLLRAHRIVAVTRVGREAHYVLADSHVRALLELALDHVGHSTLVHQAHGAPASCTGEPDEPAPSGTS